MRDPPPPGLEKPFDRQSRTLFIIRTKRNAVLRSLREGVDDRHMQIRQIDGQAPVQPLAGRNDAVDLLVQHRIDMGLGECRIVLYGA